MDTYVGLDSQKLREIGITRIDVKLEIERVSDMYGKYHRAGEIVEIEGIDTYGMDDPGSLDDLKELARSEGYEDVCLFLWESFDEKLNNAAAKEGPRIEEAQRSAYMAEKAESDYHL